MGGSQKDEKFKKEGWVLRKSRGQRLEDLVKDAINEFPKERA